MAEKKKPDWERIECDYRAGVKSIREIASENGISDMAIRKRAKAQDWERDLAGKVAAKAEALVRKAEVREEVRNRVRANEQDIIDANAQAIANVKIAHRTDLRRYRDLVNHLMAEVEAQTNDQELYRQLGELMHSNDKDAPDKLNEVYRRVISLPQRTKVMLDLVNALKVLVTLERESYGIQDGQPKVNVSITSDRQTVQEVLSGFDQDY